MSLFCRNAKKHLERCLHLIDIDDLLGAIRAIEKAINLQPDNEFFNKLSEHLNNLLSLRMEDSYRGPQNNTTASKQEHCDLYEKVVSPEKGQTNCDSQSFPRDKNFSSFNGFENQTTHNDDKSNIGKKKTENGPSGKCSKCQSCCEEKHSRSSSEFPMEEKPGHSEPLLSDQENEGQQDSHNDSKIPFWFPNPAKYNIDGFDVDARFFEEVCKQRESADCWDTYMKLLSDKSQDDDDESDANAVSDNNSDDNDEIIGSFNDCSRDDTRKHKPYSSSHAYERTKKFTEEIEEDNKCTLDSNSSRDSCKKESKPDVSYGNSSSPNNAPEQEEKERLYFLNGTGYYGIPASTSADASKIPSKNETPSKLKMDSSEKDFYENLRFYFNVSDSMPHKKTNAATSQVDSSTVSSGSTKQHYTSNTSETKPPTMGEEKENVPSKKTLGTESDRDTPPVAEEKPYSTSNIYNSISFSNKPQVEKESKKDLDSNLKKVPVKGAKKVQVPKRGNSSDKKGKKVSKNRGISQDENIGQQTTTKTRPTKKNKQKFAESAKENEPIPGEERKERRTRMAKEERPNKIPSRSGSSQLKDWTLQSGQKIGLALLWTVYYSVIILLITLVFTAKCLYGISKFVFWFVIDVIMSWGIAIAAKNKLSIWKAQLIVKVLGLIVWVIQFYCSCKSRCVRWYFGIKTLGVRKFLFGSRRTAQTYNLPNSGEDAVKQLLLKRNSDPYSILGVPNEASNDDIKKQYRKLAVLVHPDKNPDPHAAEAFRILSGAYDIIGNLEKRLEFDADLARRQAYETSTSQNPTRDFTNPRDVVTELLRQMEEIKESLSCDVCEKRHRRILTDRDVICARHCYSCNTMHQSKEGDFWKESSYMGLGTSKFYARMEGRVYDISEWGQCQERNGFNLPADSHQVLGKITTRPTRRPPTPDRFEEEFWRDFFRQQDPYGGDHGNQSNINRQQRSRRRKRR